MAIIAWSNNFSVFSSAFISTYLLGCEDLIDTEVLVRFDVWHLHKTKCINNAGYTNFQMIKIKIDLSADGREYFSMKKKGTCLHQAGKKQLLRLESAEPSLLEL